jgi:acetyltransferase-like isoleucine patch superfamily enzyme
MKMRDDLNIEELQLDEELVTLWKQLQTLHFKLRDFTKRKYNRVNPFTEDLFEWKEKGRFFGGKNVTIYDSTTITGDVKIGDNTWIGPFCSIDGTGGLAIGVFCCISSGVRIVTHDTIKWSLSGGKTPYEHAPVVIGDCTFIGVESVVIRGVTIGKHCLIGANSVITSDIPDYSIALGSPAKIAGKVEIDREEVKLVYFH